MATKREIYSSWDEYFMGLAMWSSTRSKDPKTPVGACIVTDEKRIISVGYNGLTAGMDDDKFPWDSIGEETNCLYTTKNPWVVHSELNAILNSHGADLRGTTMYITLFPCNECAKAIIQAGIKKVIYLSMYAHRELVEITKEMFKNAGVVCMPFNSERDFSKQEVQGSCNQMLSMIKNFSETKTEEK
ncbi:MAG: dCMP deaminase family protein [Clostridia bacterium]|nr:dCMP deaminase family protein [Clostridia bacterium]